MTKPALSPKYQSNRLILNAVDAHIAAYGGQQKAIALDAGLNPNYVSMLKKDSRPALKQVIPLKGAMPDLDDLRLTATILTEMHPEPDAQEAILRLAAFLGQPPTFEQALLDLAQDVRDNEGAAGLYFPAKLPDDIKTAILGLLREAVQRETRAAMPE